jgi:hypothetical protein
MCFSEPPRCLEDLSTGLSEMEEDSLDPEVGLEVSDDEE